MKQFPAIHLFGIIVLAGTSVARASHQGKHADINTPKSPVTLLIRAAEKGDLKTVQDLLSTKTWLGNPMLNVNSIDCDRNRYPETGSMTALIAAAQARHRRIIRELLRYGADLTHKQVLLLSPSQRQLLLQVATEEERFGVTLELLLRSTHLPPEQFVQLASEAQTFLVKAQAVAQEVVFRALHPEIGPPDPRANPSKSLSTKRSPRKGGKTRGHLAIFRSVQGANWNGTRTANKRAIDD